MRSSRIESTLANERNRRARAEAERDRLQEALEEIAVGRWNHGRARRLTVHEYARAALIGPGENDGC